MDLNRIGTLGLDWDGLGLDVRRIGVRVASYRRCIDDRLTSDWDRIGMD